MLGGNLAARPFPRKGNDCHCRSISIANDWSEGIGSGGDQLFAPSPASGQCRRLDSWSGESTRMHGLAINGPDVTSLTFRLAVAFSLALLRLFGRSTDRGTRPCILGAMTDTQRCRHGQRVRIMTLSGVLGLPGSVAKTDVPLPWLLQEPSQCVDSELADGGHDHRGNVAFEEGRRHDDRGCRSRGHAGGDD